MRYQENVELLHYLLQRVATGNGYFSVTPTTISSDSFLAACNTKEIRAGIERLVELGFINLSRTHDQTTELTLWGEQLVQQGGYKVYAEQQAAQAAEAARTEREQHEFARMSAIGTWDSARMAKRSLVVAWVAAGISALAVGVTIWQVVTAGNQQAQSERRIQQLEKQVKQLLHPKQ